MKFRTVTVIIFISALIFCGCSSNDSSTVCDDRGEITDDSVFQEAINLLPENGGILQVRNSHYVFRKPITKQSGNITIMGIDFTEHSPQVYFSNDNSNPLFIVGGKGWTFIDLHLDLGGIDFNGFEPHTHLIRVIIEDNSLFPESKGNKVMIK